MIMSAEEKWFKALVTELICYKLDLSEEREQRLLGFHNQAEFYYGLFCESIYMLSVKNDIETISLDDFGYTHFNYINHDNIVGYALLSEDDINQPVEDIILYIRMALERLDKRLHGSSCGKSKRPPKRESV